MNSWSPLYISSSHKSDFTVTGLRPQSRGSEWVFRWPFYLFMLCHKNGTFSDITTQLDRRIPTGNVLDNEQILTKAEYHTCTLPPLSFFLLRPPNLTQWDLSHMLTLTNTPNTHTHQWAPYPHPSNGSLWSLVHQAWPSQQMFPLWASSMPAATGGTHTGRRPGIAHSMACCSLQAEHTHICVH